MTARNEAGKYWAVTVDGHEEWGETTAWRTDQVRERAVDLIASHTRWKRENIAVIVQHTIRRRD